MPRGVWKAAVTAMGDNGATFFSGLRGMGGHLGRSWSLGWPMILIMAFEFLINLTDVYIAGLLDRRIQAAVGFSTQVYFIFIVIANALTVGTVSVCARLYAGGKREELSRTVSTVTLAVLAAGVVLGAGGVLLSPLVLPLLNVPREVMDRALPLVRIYAAGLPFHYLLVNSNGILRATGGVRHSLVTMAAVCAANVGLNFLMVFHTPLGYHGIALSTVISVVAGAGINSRHVKKLVAASFAFSREILSGVANIGWPAAVQQASWHVGSTVMFLILGALPGDTVSVMAAFTNGLRIEAAIFLPAFALNMANAVVVGNMLGAGRKRDAFRGGVATALIGVGVISVLTVITLVNARSFSSMLSGDARVVEECARYLLISMISEPFMAWGVILGGGLMGAGDTRSMMYVITGTFWTVRIPLAYVLGVAMGFGPPGVWWAMNASIAANAALLSARYFRKRWIS